VTPEVLDVGTDQPPWSPRRRALAGALAAVVLAAGVGWSLGRNGAAEDDARPGPTTPAVTTEETTRLPNLEPPPTTLPLVPIPDGIPVALMIGPTSGDMALERQDADAATSPWAVVVRRNDGSFGRHGAVVTFPVSRPRAGRSVAVGDATGTAAPKQVTWPIGGAWARVRGDLSERDLVAVARGVRIRDGHPQAVAPPGFRTVVAEQYEPTAIRELRFGGLAGEAFGLTYTAVLAAAGFEDQIYAIGGISGGTVGGQPAIASAVGGGNGTLAWEAAPGVVALVGYSGSLPFGPEAIPRLRELGEGARYLTGGAAWRYLKPVTQAQDNAFGFDDFG
jgi:hypothetical protein